MHKIFFILLSLSFLLIGGCNNKNPEPIFEPILYEFKEPTSFPFEVNDVKTRIDFGVPNVKHQFGFNYRNKETTQQIAYTLVKIFKGGFPENPHPATPIQLDKGVPAYYEESATYQRLYWDVEDGFHATLTYYTDENTTDFAEYRLDVEDLIRLADEVNDTTIYIKENSPASVSFKSGAGFAEVNYKNQVVDLLIYVVGLDPNDYYEIFLENDGEAGVTFGPEANVNIQFGTLKNETNFYPTHEGILSVSMINPERIMLRANELKLIVKDKNGDVVVRTKPFQVIK